MSHKILRPFIVKVSVLGYFPLYYIITRSTVLTADTSTSISIRISLYLYTMYGILYIYKNYK